MYEIKKGIPMPDKQLVFRSYPWRDLEIGDCFDVPLDRPGMTSVRPSLFSVGKKTGRKFSTKILRSENVLRVWRTE